MNQMMRSDDSRDEKVALWSQQDDSMCWWQLRAGGPGPAVSPGLTESSISAHLLCVCTLTNTTVTPLPPTATDGHCRCSAQSCHLMCSTNRRWPDDLDLPWSLTWDLILPLLIISCHATLTHWHTSGVVYLYFRAKQQSRAAKFTGTVTPHLPFNTLLTTQESIKVCK